MEDRTKAMALQIAKELLLKHRWSYSYEEIGRNAAKILKAMDKELVKKDQSND